VVVSISLGIVIERILDAQRIARYYTPALLIRISSREFASRFINAGLYLLAAHDVDADRETGGRPRSLIFPVLRFCSSLSEA